LIVHRSIPLTSGGQVIAINETQSRNAKKEKSSRSQ
jgi:hypothetical protein